MHMENYRNEKDLYEETAAKVADVMGDGIMVDSPKFNGFGNELNW